MYKDEAYNSVDNHGCSPFTYMKTGKNVDDWK